MRRMQRALSLIFPDQCVLCSSLVNRPGALCADCWRTTPFLTGLVCNACGASLPGNDDDAVLCDDCLAMPRPWELGRAALSYREGGRRIVLALKHADRTDLALPAADWMRGAGAPFLGRTDCLVPVPVHWSRLLSRRYSQAAELARALGRLTNLTVLPDALERVRRTPIQDGMTVEQRMANLDRAMRPNPRRQGAMDGQRVCLIDDVMTSGATLAAATAAAHAAGAMQVFALVLARVEKRP